MTTQPKITTSGSTQQSAAVNDKTKLVSIRPIGGGVYIDIGSNSTASDTDKYLADGQIYDVAVSKGDKIGVIDA